MIKKITIICALLLTACPGGEQVFDPDVTSNVGGSGGDGFRLPPMGQGGKEGLGGYRGTGGALEGGFGGVGGHGGMSAGQGGQGGTNIGGAGQGGMEICPEGMHACKENCGWDMECKKWCWENCRLSCGWSDDDDDDC